MAGMDDLRAAGFPEDEVQGWASRQRATLSAAGFSTDEIKNYLNPASAAVSPKGGSMEDVYYGQSSIGRILHAFGQGAAQGWGSDPIQLSPDTEDFLKKSGVFNDYENGRTSFIKSINEAFVRPAATALNTVMQAGSALFGGAQAAVAQAGAEIGAPRLGRELAAMPEAFFGTPGGLGVHLPEARDLNIIGPGGEAAWKGYPLQQPTPRARAGFAQFDAQAEAIRQSTAEQEAAPTAPIEAPVDIHAAAREIAPVTFQQYDALVEQRDAIRRYMADLQGGSEIAEMDERIDQMRAQRLTAARGDRRQIANEITSMEEERARLVDQLGSRGDTPEMRALRQQLQEADYRMRDLAPDVAAAYREAQAREPSAEPAGGVRPAEEAEAPMAQPVPIEAPAEPPQQPAIQNIAEDVSRKLTDAGRPQEESDAAGTIIAEYYRTRAARFGGAKGSPEEIYANEAPRIERGELEHVPERAAGAMTLRDGRLIINLMGRADASTFIHETGHAWLEDLLFDEKDPRAPPDLKADVSAVRDWLGAAPNETITRRQHEKFARGFERYMMEGTAPSRALASVFAKFQEWLTAIYRTVGRLRSPITDDIRDVFDRMLSTTPEKVVAPERATPASFADAHETTAETTLPPQAAVEADRIRGERDEIARQHAAPGFDAERRRQREAGTGPAGGGISDRGGDAGRLEPVGADVGAQPGTIGPSGSQATPQGARPPTTEPASPNESFNPRAESTFVDKAGNIRLDNLNTPEDVNAVIREAADQNENFVNARRGVISDAEVLDLASALGMDAGTLDRRRIGEAFNAEQIMAARKLLVQSATNVRDLAAKAVDGGDEELMAFGEAATRHRMIQEHVAGITAEAGRALRAFHLIEGGAEARDVGALLAQSVGRTLYQMRQQAKQITNLGTPAQVSGYLNAAAKPGAGAMLLEIFKNWLISGPITHATYAIGNTLLALYKAIPETAAEATVGLVREAITGAQPGRVRFGEISTQAYAIFRGQRDGWKAAFDSFKAGQTMALPHEILDSATQAERAQYDRLRAAGATHDQALTHMGIVAPVTKTPFTNTQAVPNLSVGGVSIPLGSIVRAPGERMVAPIHSYFRTIGYLQSIARQAYRIASDQGLIGSAFNLEVARLTRDPTEEMMTTARNEATEQTLMGRGHELTKAVSALVNIEPNLPLLGPTRPLAFIDPFVHIQSNILEQSVLERGPLGLMSERLRSDIAGRNGVRAQDTAIARISLGTSLSAVGMGLAIEGLLNPSAPSDPHEAGVWRMVHGMPHSLRIGDWSIDLSRLGVLGFQMGIAADLHHVWQALGEQDITKVGALLVHSIAQNFLDEGFMRGPSDMIKALDEPDRYGANYIRNFLSSMAVPYSVGMQQLARQVDPFARQARNMLDEIKAKVPWWSETLLPRRDIWGEPVPNREYFGVYAQHIAADRVNQALEKLEYFPAQPQRQIRGVELTEQQYDDYSRIAGRTAKMQLDKLVALPVFAHALPESQRDMMRNFVSDARKGAADLMIMQNPSILKKALAAKRAEAAGETHSEIKALRRQ